MSAPENEGEGFRREIGLFDAVMLVVGVMIGSGIFIVSKDIAQDVGSPGALLLVWIATGVMTVFGALCYAELAGMMPHAGGQYVYLKRAFSPICGYLYGWTLFTVIQTGSIAAVAVAFTKFLGVFAPAWGTDVVIDPKEGRSPAQVIYRSAPDMAFSIDLNLPKLGISRGSGDAKIDSEIPPPVLSKPLRIFERFGDGSKDDHKPFTITIGQLLAAALIAGLTLLNCFGVRGGKWVQNIFTVAKTAALLAVIGVGLFIAADPAVIKQNWQTLFDGGEQTKRFLDTKALLPIAPTWLLLAMVAGGAMVGSLFSADAWNNITFTGGEVKNPSRTLPAALGIGASLVIGLYLLANLAYLAVLPIKASVPKPAGTVDARTALERGIADAKDDRVATAVMEQAGEKWSPLKGIGAAFMAAAVMVSTFGCLNGMILMGARLYYALAADGLFFHSVGSLNGRGVPAVALILQGLWSIALVFSGTYNDLLDYVIFAALLFYALTVLGLFVLRRREPHAPRPYRVFAYPVLPALYLAMCVLVMLDLLVVRPTFTWPGLIIVLAGIPVYWIWTLFSRPRASD
ncbi:MAG TPA: amino acid permease [Planctomycetia bacterium]|nr:amino acid permease [Planctomycetia bacterium]